MSSSRTACGRLTGVMAIVALVAACDSSPTDDLNGPAILSVHLTDAPGDLAAVWVDVAEMYFMGTPEGRTALTPESTGLIELTSLVGTTEELVSGLELPPGRYRELRFVLSGGVLETTEGEVFTFGGAEHPDGLPSTGELRCPSCSSSGLKAKLADDEVALESGSQVLLLDFDVSRSFGRAAGNSGAWVMRPVVNGTVQAGPTTGASISGTVSMGSDAGEAVVLPACPADQQRTLADFVPTATAGTLVDGDGVPITKSGTTAADGLFTIAAVDSDIWAMGYHSEVVFGDKKLVLEATADPAEVTVDGDVTGVAYTITRATCEDAGTGQAGNPTTATVFLTDAPGNVDALWVDIEEIYAQGGPSGRHTLMSEATGLVEVSALVETVQQLGATTRLAPGRYSQLRMVLTGAVLETTEGEVFSFGDAVHPAGIAATGILSCPSCTASGLKVKTSSGGLMVMAGENNGLVFDLDIKQSLDQIEDGWRLAPVVYGVRTLLGEGRHAPGPNTSAGMLAGTVRSDVDIPSCPAETPRTVADFVPEVTARKAVDSDGEAIKRTATVDPLTGSFIIDFLDEDRYELGYAAEVVFSGWALEFVASAAPHTVNVKSGALAENATYRITEATCSERPGGG